MRILSWIAGVLLGLGIVDTLIRIDGWLGNGYYTGRPFLVTALVAPGVAWALRRRLRSPALRTTTAVGAFTTVVLALVFAVNAGFIDTKAASRAAAMRYDLSRLDSWQEEFRRDSGRYTTFPRPDYQFSDRATTHAISLTRDGWTASATNPELQRTCAIFVGSTPIAPAVREHDPTCTRPPIRPSDYGFSVLCLAAAALLATIARARENPSTRHTPAQHGNPG